MELMKSVRLLLGVEQLESTSIHSSSGNFIPYMVSGIDCDFFQKCSMEPPYLV